MSSDVMQSFIVALELLSNNYRISQLLTHANEMQKLASGVQNIGVGDMGGMLLIENIKV